MCEAAIRRSAYAAEVMAQFPALAESPVCPCCGEWRQMVRPKYDRTAIAYLVSYFEVNLLTGCWEWQGSAVNGYGQASLRMVTTDRMAHRIMWDWAVGLPLDGLTLDHLCCNRRCINPFHLEAVTLSENVKRMWQRKGLAPMVPSSAYWREGVSP